MKDERRAKKELIEELAKLRRKVSELEKSEAKRRLAEDALRQSENKYKTLIENLKDMVFTIDPVGKITFVSQSSEDILGYRSEEGINKNIIDFIPAEERGRVIETVQRGMKGNKIIRFQTPVVTKRGDRVILEVTVSRIWEKGVAVGALAIGRDVTERKRVEEELRKHRDHLEELVDERTEEVRSAEERTRRLNLVLRAVRNVNQLITKEKDRDKLIKGVCENLIENRGYHNAWIALIDESGKAVATAEAGLGKDFLPMQKLFEKGELTDCAKKTLSQSEIVTIENPATTCAECPLAGKYEGRGASAIRLEHLGKIYGMLSASVPANLIPDKEEQSLFKEVAGDIAFALHNMELEEERKGAEAALLDSEEKIQALLNAPTDVMHLIDSEGVVLASNKELAERLGKDLDEIVGRRVYDFYPPDIAEFRKARADEGFSSGESIRFREIGQTEVFDTHCYPVFDAEGRVTAVAVYAQDITEKLRAEDALKESQESYYNLFSTATVAIMVADETGNIVEVNPQTCSLYGYTYDEMTRLNVLDIIHPDHREHFMQMAQNPDNATFEEINLRKDGSPVQVEVKASPVIYKGKPHIMAFINDITERKLAEDSLKESEDKYRVSIESAPYGILVHDQNGKILISNPQLEKITGYSKEDIPDIQTWLEKAYPDEEYRRMVIEERKSITLEECPRIREALITRKDGEKRVCRFESLILPSGIRTVFISDITERKLAEDSLKESEDKYRNLFESIPDPAYLIDQETGQVLEVNEAAINLYGYSRDEWLKMKNTDVSAEPDETRKATKEIPGVIPTRYHKKKDGTVFPLEMTLSTIELYGEKAIIAIARDITDRKQAEQKIETAASDWRNTFDTISDIIMIVDTDFRILRVNRAAAELMGLPYLQILGRKCFRLFHGTDSPPDYCPHSKTIADKKEHTAEIHERRWGMDFRITTTPLMDTYGKLAGSVHIMRDITEQKLMEAEVLQAEKLASVGQLAAGVAHEVNNPAAFVMTNLGQLKGYASSIRTLLENVREICRETQDESLIKKIQSLEKELDIEYIERDLDDLVSESLEGMTRIRNIVADLNMFSHMTEDEVEDVNINDVVNSAINMASSEIKYRGRVEKRLGDVPGVFAIRGRLAQVVLNILVNAAHALDEGKVAGNRITVTTGSKEGRVFLSISDTGSGIPPESLERIFDAFYTTKPAGVGTGLGLAICRQIMRKHGGEISVESEEGRGSTFTLWLPIEEDIQPVLSSKPKQGEFHDESHPRSARILVVDDEKFMLSSIQRVLEPSYQVSVAASGQEALELMEHNPEFDMILCDLVMPGMDGRGLYIEVTRRWPGMEPRFLFFTGGAYTPSLREFSQKMINRTIQKPFQADEILSFIRAWLEDAGK